MEAEDYPVKSKDATVLSTILANCKMLDDKPALHWLDHHCKVVDSYSYRQLDVRSKEIARGLVIAAKARECCSQPAAVLCYSPGLNYFLTFLGCLRAGFIPVPVQSPDNCKILFKRTLFKILQDCDAAFVLGQQQVLEELLDAGTGECSSKHFSTLLQSTSAEWLYEDYMQVYTTVKDTAVSPQDSPQGLEEEIEEEELELDRAQPQEVAFLQYTVAETPKGVMVTFDNVLHNFQIMKHIYSTSSSMRQICMLPHHNGFALVGSYLHTLYEGATAYFAAPKTFLSRPGMWLEAISRYGLTHSKVPCSAFDTPQPGYGKEVNLETIACIACIEPVSHKCVDRFEHNMSQFGLRRDAISIGYGLAEHVGVVCSPCVTRDSGRAVELNRMDCGKPALGVTVKIVDQTGSFEVPEATIGEIWVSSRSKALGYFNNEQNTLDVFNARISDEPEDNLYLRTGDLGFMKDGRLFVCESLADVLTVQDKSCIYPLDVEMVAESAVSEICHGKSIAFHFKPYSNSHEISILAELKSDDYTDQDCQIFQGEVEREITSCFDQITVHAVIFFKSGTLPCTPFGRRERRLSCSLSHATDLQLYNKWIKPKPEKWMSDKEKKRLPPKVIPTPPKKSLANKKKVLLTPPHILQHQPIVLSPVPFLGKQSSPKPSIGVQLEDAVMKSRSTPCVRVQFRPSPPRVSTYPPCPSSPTLFSPMMSPSPVTSPSPERSPSPELISPTGERQQFSPSGLHLSTSSPVLSRATYKLMSPPPRLKSPSSESRLSEITKTDQSVFSDSKYSPILKSRRSSAPHPLSIASPVATRRRKKRAKSIADEFLGKSSLEGLLHALGKTMRRTVYPGEKVWEDESKEVNEIASILQEDYGFHMSKETLILTQSPEDLLKAMKMSLLSTEIVEREPFRLSFTNLPPPIFDPFLTRVYESECRLYLKNVEQYKHKDEEIAIVGMGGLFTGASCNSIDELWDLITDHRTASSQQKQPCSTPKFDGEDFCIDDCDVPSLTSPEKLLLQAVRKCLFNAGFTQDPDGRASNWGVFAALPQDTNATASCIAGIYNFTGPVMETRTSHGSLSPLSMAFLHLQSKNCDAAIVCGVQEALMRPRGSYPYAYCAALLMMSVGTARKFDRRILAIVKATGCNYQGGGYSALYTPNRASQTQVLRQTISKASLAADEISYVEADGKGGTEKMRLEMDCIQEVLGSEVESPNDVVVSSLKANIGDLGAVSSIVSIIKTVHVLQHAQVPGTALSQATTKPTHQDRSKNLVCFPSKMTDLSSSKHGKLLSAAVNCFEDTGRNEVAVVQQYGILPHLAGVSAWLMFAADHIVTDKCWPEEVERKASFYRETIEALKSQIPVFANAFTCFTRVFDATVKRYNFDSVEVLAARNKVMVLKLYYGFMAHFFSSGLNISVIGSTNAMNEVAALLFAGSIDLSTAILFLCCKHVSIKDSEKPTRYKIGPQKLAKLMRKPQIPIFSCIEDERLSEAIFADKTLLLQYVTKLCDNIGETHLYYHLYKILISKGPAKPFIYINSVDNSRNRLQRKSLVTIAFKCLQDDRSTRYLRDCYMNLRSYYDSTVEKAKTVVKEKEREMLLKSDIDSEV